MTFIPYGRQEVTEGDIAAVVAVLRSDWLTQGPVVPDFEAAVARACGVAHGVAVNSATSALHVACLALGLGPGDRLWTSPITFLASANCALYCGAQVDFVDVDCRTGNLSVEALAYKFEVAAAANALPKILVPVHLAGQSCDMAAIGALAQRHGVRVIEDASHAIGGSLRGEPIGNCRYSDITVLSFHPVKIITTGEGGMAVTQDEKLAERMALLRSHGMTRDPALMERQPDGPWSYDQIALGFNYRMTDLQAALGRSQLGRLPECIDRREALANRYDQLLAGLDVRTPIRESFGRSAWHLYIVQVEASQRRAIFDALRAANIGVNVHYIPVHTQPHYRRLGFHTGQFPAAEAFYANAISLPMYVGLTDAQQDRVVDGLRRALQP
jgi:UDP-4-amino-4,6-dideoxy-N-acetyl-beta-L-altrosamine transaminase